MREDIVADDNEKLSKKNNIKYFVTNTTKRMWDNFLDRIFPKADLDKYCDEIYKKLYEKQGMRRNNPNVMKDIALFRSAYLFAKQAFAGKIRKQSKNTNVTNERLPDVWKKMKDEIEKLHKDHYIDFRETINYEEKYYESYRDE